MNYPKISFLIPVYNRKNLLYNSMQSIFYFYAKRKNIEYVIVDDGSDDSERFDNIQYDFPELNIKHVRIDKKRGFNPSFAYNVAARRASGQIFILSSAENIHTQDIFELCSNFEHFQKNDYYLFSVFCLTEPKAKTQMIDFGASFDEKLNIFYAIRSELYLDLGCNGYSYSNNYGAWYLHETIKPSKLNFLTALHKDLYYEISGFNEEFMNGTGYDDQDFLDRLSPLIHNWFWFNAEALHIDHDVANKNIAQNSNNNLYLSLSTNQTYTQNDKWGLL